MSGRTARGVRRAFLAGALVLAAACSDGGPEVPERAADDAPVRTTSTTTAPAPGLERVATDPSVLEGEASSRFTGVAVGARAIVVVGEVEGEAAIWTTVDGVEYEPVRLDPGDFPTGTALLDLAVTPAGFVVVGSAGGEARAWASPDGRLWAAGTLAGGELADVVIVGELGITAFGRDGGGVTSWTSFDGLVWQPVAVEGDVEPAGARVVGAHDDGDGFVAVVDRAGGVEAWRSPDGRSWTSAPLTGAELLPAGGPPRPTTVLGAGSTVIVLGAVEDPDGVDAAVWTAVAGAPWERATTSEAVFGGDGAQVVEAATQLGSDLVAVGTDTDVEGDVDAVVWSAGAGGGWRRSPDTPSDGRSGPGDQHAVDVAPTRDGALVVGWEQDGDATRAVAWSLVEGEPEEAVPASGLAPAWRRVPPGEALGGPGEQQMDGVAAIGDELVGVGTSARPAEPAGDLDGAVWTSGDGLEWVRSVDDALGGPEDQRLLDVAGGSGGVVAVGGDGGSAGVWVRPPGGEAWARAPGGEAVFGGPGDQLARSVTVAPDGSAVAVGVDRGSGDGDAAVWRAPAGGAWARVLPGGDLGGDGVQTMAAVTVVGPLLVAVGSSGADAVAWWSLDGLDWERAVLGQGGAESLAVVDGGVVAVGSRAGGAGPLDAAAWRSTDGRAWSAVAFDDGPSGASDQQLLDVLATATPGGRPLVAGVGWTGLGPGDDGAAWASEDGELWSRAPHDEDVFGGDQAQRMQAIGALGDVLVAVGWSGTEPAGRDAAVWVTAPAGGGGVL